MYRRFRYVREAVAILAIVAMLAPGVTRAAPRDDVAASSQPSAIEHLVRQEDARAAELARFDAVARGHHRTTMLDARERARASAAATPIGVVTQPGAGEAFAWGAAALGLGAGIAGMCVLLGCVTLVRSHGRLRSV